VKSIVKLRRTQTSDAAVLVDVPECHDAAARLEIAASVAMQIQQNAQWDAPSTEEVEVISIEELEQRRP